VHHGIDVAMNATKADQNRNRILRVFLYPEEFEALTAIFSMEL
jgi:hypothetical protein